MLVPPKARRNQPEQAVGPVQGPAENGGVIVRALDDFHPAAHAGVESDRVPYDHPDGILAVEQERQHLFADLTGWSGDHQHAVHFSRARYTQRNGDALRMRRLAETSSGLQARHTMTRKRAQTAGRKPRSDAQKNRGRILEAAKEAFTRSGANASLDDIAKQAGVGPGTLYRHFPTRDELLEAVYRTEVEKLAAAERNFAETLPPLEALRAWMLLFVDVIATKRIIAPALNTLASRPATVFEASHGQMRDAIRALVKRAVKSGDIRKDLDAIDLLRALIGVANVATTPDWQHSAKRLVDILITGSRPVK